MADSGMRPAADESVYVGRGRCDGCKADVVFEQIDAQQVCTECGAVNQEEQVFDVQASYPVEQRKRRPNGQRPAASFEISTTQRVVNRRQDDVQQDASEALRRRLDSKTYEEHINGLLSVLGGYEHLRDDVKALIRRSNAVLEEQMQNDGEAVARSMQVSITHKEQLIVAIVAACYMLVQQRRISMPMTMTLEQLCALKMLTVGRVKTLLTRLEAVGAGALQGGKTYDKPRDFVDAQIRFLNEQLSLPPRKRGKAATLTAVTRAADTSLFDRHEQAFLMRAQPRSDAFSKVVHTLATLCASHGMANRTARRRNQVDLAACAWAMLMLAVEAQTAQECHEQRMAEVAAWAPGCQALGGARGCSTRAPPDGVDASDESAREEARSRAIRTTSLLVRKRYQEIARMLSVYVRALPWFDEKESGRVKKRKADEQAGSSAITSLPRKVIVQHLCETLRLHEQLRPKVAAQLQSGELWSGEVIGAEAVEEGELAVQPSQTRSDATDADTEASASQESGGAPQPMFRWATFMLRSADKRKTRIGDEVSSLASSIGPTLLTLEMLEQMDDATVDRLLFSHGELDAYVRTPEEVSLRRQAQGRKEEETRADAQEDDVEAEVMDDETIEAVIAGALPPAAPTKRSARRTKARSQTEFRQILDELMAEASEV